jgi:hypothetical protein
VIIDLHPVSWIDAVTRTWFGSALFDVTMDKSLVSPIPSRVTTKATDLSRRYGQAFTLSHELQLDGQSPQAKHLCEGVPGCRVRYRWTLSFVPVERAQERERWQVEVRGRDRWSWGEYAAGPGAGVWVDWVHRTVLQLEDGKPSSATGQVTVARVTSFSDPEGVFEVEYATTTRPAYTLSKVERRGQTVELGLLHDPGSTYKVDFSLRLAGPAALERLRAARIPNADAVYERLAQRGAITNSVAPLVPMSPRVVVRLRPGTVSRVTEAVNEQLPCTLFGSTVKDCFLTRGGEIVTVVKLG